MKKNKISRKDFEKTIDHLSKNHDHMVAIYKPCPNKGKPCFCTGECQTIIGYREKHRLE